MTCGGLFDRLRDCPVMFVFFRWNPPVGPSRMRAFQMLIFRKKGGNLAENIKRSSCSLFCILLPLLLLSLKGPKGSVNTRPLVFRLLSAMRGFGGSPRRPLDGVTRVIQGRRGTCAAGTCVFHGLLAKKTDWHVGFSTTKQPTLVDLFGRRTLVRKWTQLLPFSSRRQLLQGERNGKVFPLVRV